MEQKQLMTSIFLILAIIALFVLIFVGISTMRKNTSMRYFFDKYSGVQEEREEEERLKKEEEEKEEAEKEMEEKKEEGKEKVEEGKEKVEEKKDEKK